MRNADDTTLPEKDTEKKLSKNEYLTLTPQLLPQSSPFPPISLPRPFKHLVFIYGTLKRNMRNHHKMAKPGIAFAFKGKTVDPFPMFQDPDHRFRPAVLDAPGIGYKVEGEVYAVNDEELRVMDKFERVPTQYHRSLVKVSPILDSHFDLEIARHLFGIPENSSFSLSATYTLPPSQSQTHTPTFPPSQSLPCTPTSIDEISIKSTHSLPCTPSSQEEESLDEDKHSVSEIGDTYFGANYVVLAYIYCQDVNSELKTKLFNQLTASQSTNEKEIQVSNCELEDDQQIHTSLTLLPPTLERYGTDEDKLYTPRILENVQTSGQTASKKLQHLSEILRNEID